MDLRRLLALPAVLALVAPSMAGCASDAAEDEEAARTRRGDRVSDASERLAQAGAWKLPASVKAAGEKQRVAYDSPPKWSGGKNCTGTFTKGAAKLKAHLLSRYDGISTIGGYACRQNTANKAETSVHGTGRALDIMIPTIKGKADNTVGDEIANWLVVNAEDLGVQFIVWDQTKWNASYSSNKAKPYTGPNPHVDHIHVELDHDGAAMKTAWFKGDNADATGSALPDANEDNADSANAADVGSGNDDAEADHAHEDAAEEATPASAGCGDVTASGTCDGNTLKFCDNEELIAAPCASGTTCGDDFPGSGYKVCVKAEAAEPVSDTSDLTENDADSGAQPTGADGGACGTVDEIGVCQNGNLSFCDAGALRNVSCKAAGRTCGYDSQNGWYDCLLVVRSPARPTAPAASVWTSAGVFVSRIRASPSSRPSGGSPSSRDRAPSLRRPSPVRPDCRRAG